MSAWCEPAWSNDHAVGHGLHNAPAARTRGPLRNETKSDMFQRAHLQLEPSRPEVAISEQAVGIVIALGSNPIVWILTQLHVNWRSLNSFAKDTRLKKLPFNSESLPEPRRAIALCSSQRQTFPVRFSSCGGRSNAVTCLCRGSSLGRRSPRFSRSEHIRLRCAPWRPADTLKRENTDRAAFGDPVGSRACAGVDVSAWIPPLHGGTELRDAGSPGENQPGFIPAALNSWVPTHYRKDYVGRTISAILANVSGRLGEVVDRLAGRVFRVARPARSETSPRSRRGRRYGARLGPGAPQLSEVPYRFCRSTYWRSCRSLSYQSW